MTIYITQGRYTQQAIMGMAEKPEDRREVVAKMMEASGFKLLDYYITLGAYDFLIICEGDGDPADLLAPLIVAGAGGSITDLTTTTAFSTADFKKASKKAGKILKSFRPAGGG